MGLAIMQAEGDEALAGDQGHRRNNQRQPHADSKSPAPEWWRQELANVWREREQGIADWRKA